VCDPDLRVKSRERFFPALWIHQSPRSQPGGQDFEYVVVIAELKMNDHQRCTLWPSSGLRVLADGFTIMHLSPTSVRPLAAHLSSPLGHVGGYFEVRVLASPKNGIKVGLFDPSVAASRGRAGPVVEDISVSLSADTGVLVIKTKDGSRRLAATTFGAGDTLGLGHETADKGPGREKSPGGTRHAVYVTRNGRRVETFTMPDTLQCPLDLHPVVALSHCGDFVCLDFQCTGALRWWPQTQPLQSSRISASSLAAASPSRKEASPVSRLSEAGSAQLVVETSSPRANASRESTPSSAAKAKNVSGLLVFDRHFRKNRVSSHYTVQKITKSGLGAVHVKKDLWSLAACPPLGILNGSKVQICYFEVTFSLSLPNREKESASSSGVRARLSRAESSSEGSLFSASSCSTV